MFKDKQLFKDMNIFHVNAEYAKQAKVVQKGYVGRDNRATFAQHICSTTDPRKCESATRELVFGARIRVGLFLSAVCSILVTLCNSPSSSPI